MSTEIIYKGTTIRLSSNSVGTKKIWGGVKCWHRVYVSCNNAQISFSFYNNTPSLDRNGLIEALYCAVGDAWGYESTESKEDFAHEYGYDLPASYEPINVELENAYNGCMSLSKKMQKLSIGDTCEFANWLQRKVDL